MTVGDVECSSCCRNRSAATLGTRARWPLTRLSWVEIKRPNLLISSSTSRVRWKWLCFQSSWEKMLKHACWRFRICSFAAACDRRQTWKSLKFRSAPFVVCLLLVCGVFLSSRHEPVQQWSCAVRPLTWVYFLIELKSICCCWKNNRAGRSFVEWGRRPAVTEPLPHQSHSVKVMGLGHTHTHTHLFPVSFLITGCKVGWFLFQKTQRSSNSISWSSWSQHFPLTPSQEIQNGDKQSHFEHQWQLFCSLCVH